MQLDYIIQGIIFSKLSSIEINFYYSIFIFVTFMILKNEAVNEYIYNKAEYFLRDHKKISLTYKQNERSRTTKNFKALMHYISTKSNKSIKQLSESVEFVWSREDDDDVEKFTGYRINQEDFMFTDNILGKFWVSDESYKIDDNNRRNRKFINVEVYSYKVSLEDLIDWVNCRVKEYDNYLKRKAFDNQILIDVSYDEKEKDIVATHENWDSNVTFENRFFENKDIILKKIDFFLNNKEWYKKKGIPYVLGFLLHGKPGCGKTSFIKALLNYTKRHGINIKLTNNFDMDCLKEIIQKEKVDEYIIPNDKRILIFEDIDCMGNIVKKRGKEDKETSDFDDVDIEGLSNTDKNKIKNLISNKQNNSKNNLSYFLNILDGLIECNGRIIIMTTNKPDDLDSALIRPGRIDEKIEFGYVSKDIFIKIIKHFYDLDEERLTLFTEKVNNNINKIDKIYSPAQLINICRGLKYPEFINKIFN